MQIFEWTSSVLHAKATTIDHRRFLVGSFNLDPLSLSNLETLVEVEDPDVVPRAEEWIESHLARRARHHAGRLRLYVVAARDRRVAWSHRCAVPRSSSVAC